MSRVRHLTASAVDLALEATVVPSFSRVGYAVRSRLERWEELTSLPAEGRHVLVTGANSGLGYATARAVLAAGGEVTGTVRSREKGEQARARLARELGGEPPRDGDDVPRDDTPRDDIAARLSFEILDLADLASVRDLADRLLDAERCVDVVVHNAGAMFADHEVTSDGLERTYQVHVVAPFLLTSLLLPRLQRSSASRVVTVTSGGMYTQGLDVDRLGSSDGYRGSNAYAHAKRAQVVLTAEWARRVPELAFHVVHPGWALTPGVESSLPTFRRLTGPLLRDPEQGADTITWLALRPDVPGAGQLWHDRRPRSAHRLPGTRTGPSDVRRLWDRVAQDAGIAPLSPPPDRPARPTPPAAPQP